MDRLVEDIKGIKNFMDFNKIEELEDRYLKYRNTIKVENISEINNSRRYFDKPSLLEFIQYIHNRDIYSYEDILRYEVLKKDKSKRISDFYELYNHNVEYTQEEIYYKILEIIFKEEGLDIKDKETILKQYRGLENKYRLYYMFINTFSSKEELYSKLFNINKYSKTLYNKENRDSLSYLSELLKIEEMEYNSLKEGKTIKKSLSYNQVREIEGIEELYYYKILNKEEYLKLDVLIYKYIIELDFLYRYTDKLETPRIKQEKINRLKGLVCRINTIKHYANNKVLDKYVEVYREKTLRYLEQSKEEYKKYREEYRKYIGNLLGRDFSNHMNFGKFKEEIENRYSSDTIKQKRNTIRRKGEKAIEKYISDNMNSKNIDLILYASYLEISREKHKRAVRITDFKRDLSRKDYRVRKKTHIEYKRYYQEHKKDGYDKLLQKVKNMI